MTQLAACGSHRSLIWTSPLTIIVAEAVEKNENNLNLNKCCLDLYLGRQVVHIGIERQARSIPGAVRIVFA